MRRRRSIRLEGYDYAAPGAYFVTICTHGRACLFGEIAHGEIKLSVSGEIAAEEWRRTAAIRSEVVLDAFVVMPNHIHAIVWFKDVGRTDPVGVQPRNAHPVGAHGGVPDVHADTQRVGAHGRAPLRRPRSLATLIAGYKSAVATRINAKRGTPGAPVWQRNYFERVVRNQAELVRIREYVTTNPLRWDLDRENPDFQRGVSV